jgi:hypothetical protein
MTGSVSSLSVEGRGAGQIRTHRLFNVSLGGTALVADEPIEVGTVLALSFESPTLRSCRGRVVACDRFRGDEYRLAVAFEAVAFAAAA